MNLHLRALAALTAISCSTTGNESSIASSRGLSDAAIDALGSLAEDRPPLDVEYQPPRYAHEVRYFEEYGKLLTLSEQENAEIRDTIEVVRGYVPLVNDVLACTDRLSKAKEGEPYYFSNIEQWRALYTQTPRLLDVLQQSNRIFHTHEYKRLAGAIGNAVGSTTQKGDDDDFLVLLSDQLVSDVLLVHEAQHFLAATFHDVDLVEGGYFDHINPVEGDVKDVFQVDVMNHTAQVDDSVYGMQMFYTLATLPIRFASDPLLYRGYYHSEDENARIMRGEVVDQYLAVAASLTYEQWRELIRSTRSGEYYAPVFEQIEPFLGDYEKIEGRYPLRVARRGSQQLVEMGCSNDEYEVILDTHGEVLFQEFQAEVAKEMRIATESTESAGVEEKKLRVELTRKNKIWYK
jgi:hypothetical protein